MRRQEQRYIALYCRRSQLRQEVYKRACPTHAREHRQDAGRNQSTRYARTRHQRALAVLEVRQRVVVDRVNVCRSRRSNFLH